METLSFPATFLPTPLTSLQVPLADDLIVDSNFFVTIAAGVVLALAFQFVLTAVSVAAGVTAIGDVKKSYVKSKVRPGGSHSGDGDRSGRDRSPGTAAGVKIATAFGIWSVVSACIALFGATALALNMNMVETGATNTATALVIWGLFFLVLFYLETQIVGSLLGNLITAVTTGLKSSAGAISSMFGTSPEKKAEDVLEGTIEKVRSEFDPGSTMDRLSEVLDGFLSKVGDRVPDYDDLKDDLEDIARESSNTNSPEKWAAVRQVLTKAISENGSSNDPDKKSKAEQLQQALDTITEKYKEGGDSTEGTKNVVEELTPMDRGEIDRRTAQVKGFLSGSTDSDLSPEKIGTALKAVVDHPKMVGSILRDQAEGLGRADIVELLSSNTALKKQNVEKYADRVTEALRKAAGELDAEHRKRFADRIEGRVAEFLNTTGREELDYSLLKEDVRKIIDDPKDALDVIKNRASTFDADTLRAVVANNEYVGEDRIDSIVGALSDAKEEVLEKIGHIETKVHERTEMLERKAVIQAEHARLTAASAAWWLVLSAILSAAAAIGGGMLAL